MPATYSSTGYFNVSRYIGFIHYTGAFTGGGGGREVSFDEEARSHGSSSSPFDSLYNDSKRSKEAYQDQIRTNCP